jgi:hypothetical protein
MAAEVVTSMTDAVRPESSFFTSFSISALILSARLLLDIRQ